MANDPGPSDWNNPARRYKWFRPRQAARGGVPKTTPSAGTFFTVSLYNSSTGATVLVLRDWSISGAGANLTALGYNKGRLTGTNYPAQSFFPGDSAPAGLVDYQAAAAALTGDYYTTLNSTAGGLWPHDFPFAIVPPGWAFFMCITIAAAFGQAGFLWEEISIDELDYFY